MDSYYNRVSAQTKNALKGSTDMLPSGLYEQLITNLLHRQLSDATTQSVSTEPLDPAEAAARLSAFIAKATQAALTNVSGDEESRLAA